MPTPFLPPSTTCTEIWPGSHPLTLYLVKSGWIGSDHSGPCRHQEARGQGKMECLAVIIHKIRDKNGSSGAGQQGVKAWEGVGGAHEEGLTHYDWWTGDVRLFFSFQENMFMWGSTSFLWFNINTNEDMQLLCFGYRVPRDYHYRCLLQYAKLLLVNVPRNFYSSEDSNSLLLMYERFNQAFHIS